MAGLSRPSTSLIGQRRDVVDARHRPSMTNGLNNPWRHQSRLGLDIQPHDPVFQSPLHRRIKFEDVGIVTRNNVMSRGGELLQRLVALERIADAVGYRKHAAFIDMRVQVRAVGGDNDIPASGLDAYA